MFRKICLVILFICILSFSFADLGPKPQVAFEVTYEGEALDFLAYAKLLEKTNCDSNAISFEEYKLFFSSEEIPQKFFRYDYSSPKISIENQCWVVARFAGDLTINLGDRLSKWVFGYNPPEEFRLLAVGEKNGEIKVFLSEPDKRTAFNSYFLADLKNDGSIVLTNSSPIIDVTSPENKLFGFAFIITITLELLFAYVFYKKRDFLKKLLKAVLVGNIITLPLVWLVLPKLLPNNDIFIILGYEIFAIVVEAIIIKLVTKMDYSWAFKISLILNILSVVIGTILLGFLMLFFYF